jgi:hypothetical protein
MEQSLATDISATNVCQDYSMNREPVKQLRKVCPKNEGGLLTGLISLQHPGNVVSSPQENLPASCSCKMQTNKKKGSILLPQHVLVLALNC